MSNPTTEKVTIRRYFLEWNIKFVYREDFKERL